PRRRGCGVATRARAQQGERLSESEFSTRSPQIGFHPKPFKSISMNCLTENNALPPDRWITAVPPPRTSIFPSQDRLTIFFAHVAYQMRERFLPRQIGVNSFNVRAADEFERRIGEADVVVVSGLWRNELLEKAHRLRFIQSIGAGTDQFDREKLKRRGIRLA